MALIPPGIAEVGARSRRLRGERPIGSDGDCASAVVLEEMHAKLSQATQQARGETEEQALQRHRKLRPDHAGRKVRFQYRLHVEFNVGSVC